MPRHKTPSPRCTRRAESQLRLPTECPKRSPPAAASSSSRSLPWDDDRRVAPGSHEGSTEEGKQGEAQDQGASPTLPVTDNVSDHAARRDRGKGSATPGARMASAHRTARHGDPVSSTSCVVLR